MPEIAPGELLAEKDVLMISPPDCPHCSGEREWSGQGRAAQCHFCGTWSEVPLEQARSGLSASALRALRRACDHPQRQVEVLPARALNALARRGLIDPQRRATAAVTRLLVALDKLK